MFFDYAPQLFWSSCWGRKLDNLPILVEDEFGKVPRDHFSCSFIFLEELTVVSEEDKKRVSVFSVHLDLFEDGEVGIEVILDKFLYVSLTAAFLAEELVARKSKNLETLA